MVARMAKPLLLIGNKRSGTTLLVNMLNEHPAVCVTHESDVVWILYQARLQTPAVFECFPWDAPRGMNAVLAAFGDSLELLRSDSRDSQIAETFDVLQRRVIEEGTGVHVPLKNAAGLRWIGDKKPVQHAFPAINDFIREHFSDAHFIHLIRHPQATVASHLEAARTWPVVPAFWRASAGEVLDQWCTHEEWVLGIKQAVPDRVHSLRLEDLCRQPVREMDRLLEFLELECSHAIREKYARYAYDDPNAKHEAFVLPDSAVAERLLRRYDYE
jgi:hypothetical protein